MNNLSGQSHIRHSHIPRCLRCLPSFEISDPLAQHVSIPNDPTHGTQHVTSPGAPSPPVPSGPLRSPPLCRPGSFPALGLCAHIPPRTDSAQAFDPCLSFQSILPHLYRYTNHMLTYTQPHMQMRTRQTNILSHAHRFVPLLLIDSLDSDCFNSENAARMAIYSQRTLEKFRLGLETEPIECFFLRKALVISDQQILCLWFLRCCRRVLQRSPHIGISNGFPEVALALMKVLYLRRSI